MKDLLVRVLLESPDADQMDRVAAQARTAGLKLQDNGRLETIGMLVGSIDPAALERLRAIPGVQSVEVQRVVRAFES